MATVLLQVSRSSLAEHLEGHGPLVIYLSPAPPALLALSLPPTLLAGCNVFINTFHNQSHIKHPHLRTFITPHKLFRKGFYSPPHARTHTAVFIILAVYGLVCCVNSIFYLLVLDSPWVTSRRRALKESGFPGSKRVGRNRNLDRFAH